MPQLNANDILDLKIRYKDDQTVLNLIEIVEKGVRPANHYFKFSSVDKAIKALSETPPDITYALLNLREIK